MARSTAAASRFVYAAALGRFRSNRAMIPRKPICVRSGHSMGEIRFALRLRRVMKTGVVFNLLYFLLVGSSFGTEELPRIGFLGARISASGKSGEGATIRRIIAGSQAQRIGLTENDKILALNGRAIDTDLDVENFFYRQPANATISLTILRDAKRVNLEATLPPLPRENFAGIEYTYDYIRNNKGQRLRTFVRAGQRHGSAPCLPGEGFRIRRCANGQTGRGRQRRRLC